MLAPTQSKTKISSKAVAGIIIGVVAAAAIGGAIFYFRGMLPISPSPKEIKVNIPIDLSKLDFSASDPYLVYQSVGNEEAGLRLSTDAFINQVDKITTEPSKNPYQNAQNLVSPAMCEQLKTVFTKIYFADSENKEISEMTINPQDPESNMLYVNWQANAPLDESLGIGATDHINWGVRFEYDPRYMLIGGSGRILPLSPTYDAQTNQIIGSGGKVKAKFCDGFEAGELTVKIPKQGFQNFQSENPYGTYDASFIMGRAMTESLLSKENFDIVKDQSGLTAKLTLNVKHPTGAKGDMLVFLSPDGGKTWAVPLEKETPNEAILESFGFLKDLMWKNKNGTVNSPDEPGPLEENKTLTFYIPAPISDLRMVIGGGNVTETGADKVSSNWQNAAATFKNIDYNLNKKVDNAYVAQPALFSSVGETIDLQVQKAGTTIKAEKLSYLPKYGEDAKKLADSTFQIANKPYYTQLLFSELVDTPSTIIPGLIIPFDEEKDTVPVFSLVTLPNPAPILSSASLTLEKPLPETITSTATPTPTPIIKTENGLGIEYVLQHRGQSRVVVKFRMFSADANNKELENLGSVDPRKISVKYGESKNTLNLGANVYRNPKDQKYPYVAVLQGLKGGQKTDKNNDGYKNGRYPYFFKVSYQEKSTTGDLKTLNRLQALCYYYSLLLNRPYCTSNEGLAKWEDKDAEYDGQKVLSLEKGGVGFHYNSTATTQGIKFVLANDRKIKEYDKKIGKIVKEKGIKEAIKEMYRYLDRIYVPYDEGYKKGNVNIDLNKYYDEAGVNYWTAMTDAKAIKKYYPKKGKKDVIDIFGVKFGVSASNESKEMFIQSLAGSGSENEAKAKAEAEFAYQIILKRAADESGKNYAAKLGSYRKIAEYLVVSDEYDTRVKEIEKTLGRKEAVTEMYETIYRRPADLQGVEHWTASGLALDALQKKFLTSKEFGTMK